MGHPLIWASALGVAALIAGVGYYGAGLLLFPSKMSPVDIFPEAYGLRYEKVSFKTSDGLTLRGWFIPSPRGPSEERSLIMCHGWGDNKGELLKETYFLNEKLGFNLFYFDHRSHGESEGRLTSLGPLELVDFEAAMGYLKREKPRALKRLGAFGLSMGAAIVAMAMPDHPEIKAAALESPFPNYKKVVRRWAWNNLRAPYVPFVWSTIEFIKLRSGRPDILRYNPIDFVAGLSGRPLFFIAAEDDALMPIPDVRSLYDRVNGSPKDFWIVPRAAHGKCHETSGPEYEKRVSAFFERYV